MLMLDTFGSWI